MSWVGVSVHLVFTTKNREKVLTKNIRKEIFEHIKMNAGKKGIKIDCVDGHLEHVHCLFSLNKEQSISEVVRLIKGESSHWINTNKLIVGKFAWQDDYWAVSVSESHLGVIRNYIYNQEQHHSKKSFSEEVTEFMRIYGWSYIKD